MTEKKRRRKILFRKMTWLLILWSVLILVWVVGGASGSEESVADCVADSGGVLTRADCQDAIDAGTGIGVFIVLVFGFIGFLVLGMVWFMTRPRDEGARELAREMRLAREARERDEAASQPGP